MKTKHATPSDRLAAKTRQLNEKQQIPKVHQQEIMHALVFLALTENCFCELSDNYQKIGAHVYRKQL